MMSWKRVRERLERFKAHHFLYFLNFVRENLFQKQQVLLGKKLEALYSNEGGGMSDEGRRKVHISSTPMINCFDVPRLFSSDF